MLFDIISIISIIVIVNSLAKAIIAFRMPSQGILHMPERIGHWRPNKRGMYWKDGPEGVHNPNRRSRRRNPALKEAWLTRHHEQEADRSELLLFINEQRELKRLSRWKENNTARIQRAENKKSERLAVRTRQSFADACYQARVAGERADALQKREDQARVAYLLFKSEAREARLARERRVFVAWQRSEERKDRIAQEMGKVYAIRVAMALVNKAA